MAATTAPPARSDDGGCRRGSATGDGAAWAARQLRRRWVDHRGRCHQFCSVRPWCRRIEWLVRLQSWPVPTSPVRSRGRKSPPAAGESTCDQSAAARCRELPCTTSPGSLRSPSTGSLDVAKGAVRSARQRRRRGRHCRRSPPAPPSPATTGRRSSAVPAVAASRRRSAACSPARRREPPSLLGGLVAGRLSRQTGLGCFVAYVALVPIVRRVHGRGRQLSSPQASSPRCSPSGSPATTRRRRGTAAPSCPD